jgi:hypothetical protein
MYELQFTGTNSAGWSQAVELIDATTNQALEVPDDAVFELSVRDCCGSEVLNAKTGDSHLEFPEDNVVQWRFGPDDIGGLCAGNTYKVGCTVETNTGTVQLFIGSLSFIDGVV